MNLYKRKLVAEFIGARIVDDIGSSMDRRRLYKLWQTTDAANKSDDRGWIPFRAFNKVMIDLGFGYYASNQGKRWQNIAVRLNT